MTRFRLYLAALLAPLVLPLAVLILSIIGRNSIGETVTSVVLFAPIAYLVAGFIGVPTLVVLRAFEITSLRAFLTVAAIIGLFAGVLFYLIFYSAVPGNALGTVSYFAFWIITWVLTALIFWFIRYGFVLRVATAKPNKSLDASGGGAFRNLIRPAMLD